MLPIIKYTLAAVLALAAVAITSTARAETEEVCAASADIAGRASMIYDYYGDEQADELGEQLLSRIKEEFKSRVRGALLFGKLNQGKDPGRVAQSYFETCVTEKDI